MKRLFLVILLAGILASVSIAEDDAIEPVAKASEAVKVFPATRKGGFSRKLAAKLLNHKACHGITVTADKEQADYSAMHGLSTAFWVVYRKNGDMVGGGGTMLLRTMIREMCEAIKKDSAKPKDQTHSHSLPQR